MYILLVYDVGVERVNKVLKIARVYLTWVQNSVLEGEISNADLTRLTSEIAGVIDETVDSVTFYVLNSKYNDKFTLGRVKGEPSVFY